MEIEGLLHEKIQLYIYKPSIKLYQDDTKINSPYYEEFNESLWEYYLMLAMRTFPYVLEL